MRVHHVLSFARETDERQAAALREAHRKRGRGGYGSQEACTYDRTFLHHLVTRTTRYQEPALRNVYALSSERADHFIEGVVSAHVLANEYDAFARHHPRGSMHAARHRIHMLKGADLHQRRVEVRDRNFDTIGDT